jgi:hypothetical protein
MYEVLAKRPEWDCRAEFTPFKRGLKRVPLKGGLKRVPSCRVLAYMVRPVFAREKSSAHEGKVAAIYPASSWRNSPVP